MWSTILGDSGAVSRVGKKGAKKVFESFQARAEEPLGTDPPENFQPNGQANAGS